MPTLDPGVDRRDFLAMLAALGAGALAGRSGADPAAYAAAKASDDWCGSGIASRPLYVPSDRGFLGTLEVGDEPIELRAAPAPEPKTGDAGGFSLAYLTRYRGKDYLNPTLSLRSGQRVRVDLVNAIDEPTIAHWHGLGVDSRNDGGGTVVAAPRGRYSYDFTVRDRAALYWYHPHPHGLTADQAYRGLFGLIRVDDEEDRSLRDALDLTPGATEIPLVLHDRRGSAYDANDADRMHGLLGATPLINGTACGYLDLATRIYRLRILNASNARTYRLALRTSRGTTVPFLLIGSDDGLLPAPVRCSEAFIATAERLDILVDLSDAAVGDTFVMETRSFDPMHMEMEPGSMEGMDHSMMDHAHTEASANASSATAAAPLARPFPEGSTRALLQLRVVRRVDYRAQLPTQLANVAPIDLSRATERPLRLGLSKGRWRINDRVFVMGETPIEVRRNSVETWLIRNYFSSMPHAMHLHGFHFQVLERQTSPDQLAGLKIDARGRMATDLGWKDTVLVWPGESVRIAVDFALAYPGPQTYMFHCHNLEHEDGGMMLGVKVA